jgi:hypothetical protein
MFAGAFLVAMLAIVLDVVLGGSAGSPGVGVVRAADVRTSVAVLT